MHASLRSPSSLVRETTESQGQNYGYKFATRKKLQHRGGHGYFGRLTPVTALPTPRLHFLSLPGRCKHFCVHPPLRSSTMAFNLNGFNLNQSILDAKGRRCNQPPWTDVLTVRVCA